MGRHTCVEAPTTSQSHTRSKTRRQKGSFLLEAQRVMDVAIQGRTVRRKAVMPGRRDCNNCAVWQIRHYFVARIIDKACATTMQKPFEQMSSKSGNTEVDNNNNTVVEGGLSSVLLLLLLLCQKATSPKHELLF